MLLEVKSSLRCLTKLSVSEFVNIVLVLVAFFGEWRRFGVNSKIIQTKQGFIDGRLFQLPTNKRVEAYLGFPYAEADRFEAPRPPKKWQNVLNATEYGKPCPQPLNSQMKSFDNMSEDCLFMNIFVPTGNNGSVLPVMFYIHGGAFVFRSGMTDFSILASEGNVIVVSFNYRLGALGFLYSVIKGQEQISGNYGMLDQVEALKWVHENIHSFGGDPRRITLFGSSSGSTCVSLLMLSPLVKGLYSKVILSSGSAHAMVATVKLEIAKTRTRLLLEILGCKDVTAIECLKGNNLTFAEIITAQQQINTTSLLLPFGPVVDGKFLTDEPATLLNTGNFDATDVMIGVTKDDGSVYLTPIPGIVKGVTSIENGMNETTFRKTIEEGIWTHGQDNRILKSITYEYTNWSNRNNLNITRQNFLNAASDAGFKAPAVRSAKAFAKKGLRTFLYQFEHASKYVNGAKVPFWKGVYHRADVYYVLGAPISNEPKSNDTEVMFSRKIIQLWTNFAKTGSPTSTADSWRWPRFNLDTELYVSLKPAFSIHSHLLADKMAFWNELVPSLSRTVNLYSSPSPSSASCATVTCRRCPEVEGTSGNSSNALIQRILIGAVVGLTILMVIVVIGTIYIVRKSRRRRQTRTEKYEIVATDM